MGPKSRVSVVRCDGPLWELAPAFHTELLACGYTPLSAANQLRVMAHLSRFMAARSLLVGDLRPPVFEAFLAERRELGYTCWLSGRGLSPITGFLRSAGSIPPEEPEPPTARATLLEEYRRYLVNERGLVASTVSQRLVTAGAFLARLDDRGHGLGELSATFVVEFVHEVCASQRSGTAKIAVTNLRCLLRYLHLRGLTGLELATAVPAVAGRRGTGLPRALPPGHYEALLRSCDRRRAVGRRDFAVLLLLGRLGLRAGEVASLQLADVNWRAGEVTICGKGRRQERLPLPVEVGEAIAAYLRWGREASENVNGHGNRAVFLTVRAPTRALGAEAVEGCVHEAARRAGLTGVSAHRLRHTAASEVLRAGGSLSEVAELLRQRSLSTTAIYAKVDRSALAELALPWIGAMS